MASALDLFVTFPVSSESWGRGVCKIQRLRQEETPLYPEPVTVHRGSFNGLIFGS